LSQQAGTPAAGPTRGARVLVAVVLVLVVVPGVVGFDAWPLTGWRLFSLARDADQTRWVIEAVGEDGTRRVVSLEELPLRYRHAEWPMAELPGASDERREAVCTALADAVSRVEPEMEELRIVRDRQRLLRVDGDWEIERDPEVVHTCAPGASR